jgi:dipeptidyl aminopeptidase/acylaminoacyl peptidase
VVHGTKDAAVHVDQATELVEALKQREREVVYEERAGLDQ